MGGAARKRYIYLAGGELVVDCPDEFAGELLSHVPFVVEQESEQRRRRLAQEVISQSREQPAQVRARALRVGAARAHQPPVLEDDQREEREENAREENGEEQVALLRSVQRKGELRAEVSVVDGGVVHELVELLALPLDERIDEFLSVRGHDR